MIRVTSDCGNVEVHEVTGSRLQIMMELCCIVAAVCQGWCSDEDESIRDSLKREMIFQIASALKHGEELLHGKKVSE